MQARPLCLGEAAGQQHTSLVMMEAQRRMITKLPRYSGEGLLDTYLVQVQLLGGRRNRSSRRARLRKESAQSAGGLTSGRTGELCSHKVFADDNKLAGGARRRVWA